MSARAVVVVNFGSHDLLERHLLPLTRPGGPLIVVVDSFSTAGERDRVEALTGRHGWHVVTMATNAGFGAGVNAGVRAAAAAGAESFLLLNPDARASAEEVDVLLADVEQHPMSLVAPLIRDSSSRVVFRGSEIDLRSGHLRGLPTPSSAPDRDVLGDAGAGRRPWLTGACLAVHRELFDRLGGFAEDYFLYWEDVDLSLRALDAGASLVLRRDVTVVHDEGGTQARADAARRGPAKSDTYYYFNCRNRLLFAGRHLPASSALGWAVRTPRESTQIWLRGGRRQLLTAPRSVVSAVRGSGVGLALCARAALTAPRRLARSAA
ncbi:glycosyltransferase family 2 protein [Luteipulveratus flavus]|uniref:Glycosyltransferase family 2 protein n=1 Tax=Luteipulveratus flavus TaxID=3031728 RepID=A0ABT6CC62_9MICO|nr:glycosyltransferase family 2 protein [Luteipulveratus sp. YIM 133296]MDF8266476.1 glycosyltransferase family 2 protein [Luteipulveratus sp. YIM 133296]